MHAAEARTKADPNATACRYASNRPYDQERSFITLNARSYKISGRQLPRAASRPIDIVHPRPTFIAMRPSSSTRKVERSGERSPSRESRGERSTHSDGDNGDTPENGAVASVISNESPGESNQSTLGTDESMPDATHETRPPPPGQSHERRRDPLLAAICHDLRAPLAAVTMGANFVLQTMPESDEAVRSRRVLQAILRSCKQMERLVRDFGDLSEIESHSLELRLEEHDAGKLLEMAAEAARASATDRKVTITTMLDDGPSIFCCDRDRLLRALGHVLDNAVRFSPEGGAVMVSMSIEEREVYFRVTDHGPGLSDETRSHLFDRSWHAKRAGRVGSGLGLAIVQGVLEAHGGRVEVESIPNDRTTFALILPRGVSVGPLAAAMER